ncbi:MAG: hypothetical protein HKN25_03205 [Pyrinomonadaceae bacterium]|nr:hypothetical protein [Pyrinomonadaceae bacterium]
MPVSAQVISTRAGVVKKVDGDVFYRCHENKNNAQNLANGLALHNEDTIVTAESSSIIMALNPDSYLYVDGDALIKVKNTELNKMHFDIERGEIILFIRSLKNGASLVIHTPPGILTISKGGRYRVSVGKEGNTEANVFGGELRYINEKGELVKIKKGRQVNFVEVEKNNE